MSIRASPDLNEAVQASDSMPVETLMQNKSRDPGDIVNPAIALKPVRADNSDTIDKTVDDDGDFVSEKTQEPSVQPAVSLPSEIRFEPEFQPGDDTIASSTRDLWAASAALAEDIVRTGFSNQPSNALDPLEKQKRSVRNVISNPPPYSRHLLVSTVTHVIGVSVVHLFFSHFWQSIEIRSRAFLSDVYERQWELNPDFLQRWRANLYTIAVRDHATTDTENRCLAEDLMKNVVNTLQVDLRPEDGHYAWFLKLVITALSIAKDIFSTPCSYRFIIDLPEDAYDEHQMEPVNSNVAPGAVTIAFIARPGLQRVSDVREVQLSQAILLCKPHVYLQNTEQASAPQRDLLSQSSMTESCPKLLDPSSISIGAGFSSVNGSLYPTCLRSLSSPVELVETPLTEVTISVSKSLASIAADVGCNPIITAESEDTGYLKIKRQFLDLVRAVPNVCRYLVIRGVHCTSRLSAPAFVFAEDIVGRSAHELNSFGDCYIENISRGSEYLAIFPIQIFASGEERKRLIAILDQVTQHDPLITLGSNGGPWNTLVRSRATKVHFYQIQTEITDSDEALGRNLDILPVYRYASDISQTAWPTVLAITCRGYESLPQGDRLFPRLARVRKQVFGDDEHPGLLAIRIAQLAQLQEIDNILSIYKFWDPDWKDADLLHAADFIGSQENQTSAAIAKACHNLFNAASKTTSDTPAIISSVGLFKRPRLQVEFVMKGDLHRPIQIPKMRQAVWLRNAISSIEISGTDYIQSINLRYSGGSERASRKCGVLRAGSANTAQCLILNPAECIAGIESHILEKVSKLGTPRIAERKLAFLRITTTSGRQIEAGRPASSPSRQHMTVRLAPHEFIVRIEPASDPARQAITSLNIVCGRFLPAQWI